MSSADYKVPVMNNVANTPQQPAISNAIRKVTVSAVPHKFRTVTCRHWRRGHCELGEDCLFLHGDDRKRTGSTTDVYLDSTLDSVRGSRYQPLSGAYYRPLPQTNRVPTCAFGWPHSIDHPCASNCAAHYGNSLNLPNSNYLPNFMSPNLPMYQESNATTTYNPNHQYPSPMPQSNYSPTSPMLQPNNLRTETAWCQNRDSGLVNAELPTCGVNAAGFMSSPILNGHFDIL